MNRLLGSDIPGAVTFNPAARTLTFSGIVQQFGLANIKLITNVTRNLIIYNFADATAGAVSFANNVLTLVYDTSAHSATDVLMIVVDVESYDDTYETLMRRLLKMAASGAVVDSAGRQRVTIDAATPTINVATGASNSSETIFQNSVSNPVTANSSLTNFHILEGPVDQRWRCKEDARQSFALGIRSNLVFS